MKNITLPLPVSLDEQQDLVNNVNEEIQPFTKAMRRIEKEISLLHEYRTRLIADVVTGKLDVREAAAKLSGEAPPDTVEDDIDLTIDPETANEEAVV